MNVTPGRTPAPATTAFQDPIIDQATGVLVLALRVPSSQAFLTLCDAAERHQADLTEVCQAVVSSASGEPGNLKPVLALLVRTEWGDALL